MPVLPEPSDFPSAPGQKEKDQKKPTASDFIDKGPQIPGSKLFGWRARPDATDPEQITINCPPRLLGKKLRLV